MKYNLLNIFTLLAVNTAETKYDLITSGTDSFTIDFFPRIQVLWSEELWPPSSLDLNPMECGIWSILKQKACSQSHSSV